MLDHVCPKLLDKGINFQELHYGEIAQHFLSFDFEGCPIQAF